MAEEFVELGIEGFNKVTDKYFEHGYDKAKQKMTGSQRYRSPPPAHRGYDDDQYEYDDEERPSRRYKEGRDRDRDQYQPAEYRPQDYGQFKPVNNDRARRYDEGPPPSSPRGQVAPYAAAGAAGGALAPYDKRRSERYDDRRRRRSPSCSRSSSRGHSRSRSRGHSRSEKQFKDTPSLAFDKSEMGIGIGIAGALLGGYVGREFGDKKRRDTALGALVGGIGANLLEHRWKIYQEEKKDTERQGEDNYRRREQYSSGGGGGYDSGRESGRNSDRDNDRDSGRDSRRRRRSR